MVRFNLVITLLLMISIAVKAELTNRMFDVRHVGYAEGLISQRVFSIVEDGGISVDSSGVVVGEQSLLCVVQ